MTEQLKPCHSQANEIRRYTILGGLIAGDPSSGKYVEYEDYLLVVKHLLTIIKKQETEKETRYQEGKSEIISKLINDVPNPEYIDEFIEPFRVYESFSSDHEIVSWNTDKLKQYFDVDRNFTSSYEKFQLMLDHFLWAAMALEDNCMKKKDFINYIVRDDTTHNLENYIKHKINEIKAQGIEWAVEQAAFDCVVTDDPVSVLEKVENYAEQLRAKHD